MMRSSTAVARIGIAGMLIAVACSATAQQAYPSKPIRFITPNPPGGSTTAVARLIGQKLTESWGQQVIVDNRPGGLGFIAGEALAKASPDGHTLMLIAPNHIVQPLLIPAPYDAIKDFAPVASVCSTEFVLVVHPSVQASTLQEFIALAKSKPGQLNYASSGSGSTTHLSAEMFSVMAGVRMQQVPYKGGGPALVDLIAGQVQLAFQVPVSSISHIRSGRLKAIAISGETRMPDLPQVPTFSEAGLPGFEPKTWFGILTPAGTPRAIVDKLSAELAKYLALADFREKLIGQGLAPFYLNADQFAARMAADTARYAMVIKTANIKAD